MSTEQHVVVIGGGVIGLSAYHLAGAGIRVTLIERDRCGRGASFGNAGWIVPSLIQPFNAPGAVPRSLRAMLNPHSPIALRQVPTWTLIRWGLEFFRASRADRSRASLRALAVMAASAADDVTALADRLGFEVHRTGLLVPFRSPVALDAYRQLTPRSSHWATRAGSKSWTPTLSRAVNRRWPTTSSVDCTCSTRSASVGGGHVSGAAAEALGELADGMPVIYASRTRAGAVLTRTYGSPGAELDLRQRGRVPSGLLTAVKARVLLVLLLRSGYSRQEAETWLMSEGSQRAAGHPGRVHA